MNAIHQTQLITKMVVNNDLPQIFGKKTVAKNMSLVLCLRADS